MKRIMIGVLVVLVMVLTVTAFAFTKQKGNNTKTLVMHYIEFTGTSNNDVGDPDQWADLGTGTPTLTCHQSSGIVCYVKYNGDFAAFQTYVDGKNLSQLQAAGIIQAYRP